MATDYSKKTNAELVEILKSRSLPHTGKKAEMVARLQEDDGKNDGSAPAPATCGKADATEDVIDWEDDDVPADNSTAAKPSTEAGASTIAAGGKGSVSNPVAVPNQKQDTDPAATDDLKVESKGAVAESGNAEGAEAAAPTEAAAAPAEEKPAVDYTKGLPVTELEEELKKRKARAEKFGITEDSQAAIKAAEEKLERAKRFGTGAETTDEGAVGVKKLDEALPDEKSRKRGRNDNEQHGGRGGKRRDFGGRNQRGRGNNRNRNQNQGRRGGNSNNNGNSNNSSSSNKPQQKPALSEKDALALEARKKRFATAA